MFNAKWNMCLKIAFLILIFFSHIEGSVYAYPDDYHPSDQFYSSAKARRAGNERLSHHTHNTSDSSSDSDPSSEDEAIGTQHALTRFQSQGSEHTSSTDNSILVPPDNYHNSLRHSLAVMLYNAYKNESDPRRCRSYMKEVPALLGSLSGIPLAEFAVKIAGESLFLKAYLSSSTVISVGITRVWALSLLIDEFSSTSPAKRSLRPLTHILVNTISILSALPLTYAVWSNSSSVFNTAVTFVSGTSYSVVGFYKLVRKLGRVRHIIDSCKRRSQPDTGPMELTALTELLHKFYQTILNPNDQLPFLENSRSYSDSSNDSGDSITRVERVILTDEKQPAKLKKYVKAAFYIIPISSAVVIGFLAQKGAADFTTSLYLQIPYILVTTAPNFSLQIYSTSSTVDDLWGDTINKRSYFRATSKMKYYITSTISIILATGSAAWGVEIVKQALSDSFLESTIPFFACTVIAQLVIFESHCIRDYFARSYFKYKSIEGTEHTKRKTRLINSIGTVQEQLRQKIPVPHNSEENSSGDSISSSVRQNIYAWYNPIGWLVWLYNSASHENIADYVHLHSPT